MRSNSIFCFSIDIENSVTVMEAADEVEYVVEKVLDKRKNEKGQTQYLLKWEGFPVEESTWERSSNLNCSKLIEEFESTQKDTKMTDEKNPGKEKIFPKKAKVAKRNNRDTEKAKTKKEKSQKKLNGFERGLKAEEILGANEISGAVHFLVKWEGLNEANLVPAKIANVKIPQMVIAFYEARLAWSSTKPIDGIENII